jgi:hypothetical protein
MSNKLKAALYTFLIMTAVIVFFKLSIAYAEYILLGFVGVIGGLVFYWIYENVLDNLNKNKKS